MERRVERGGIIYRLKYFINGFEEGSQYFRSIGYFTDDDMSEMAAGKTIEKNGNRFRIAYESEYGNEYAVSEIENL